jgi:hypothetical protein
MLVSNTNRLKSIIGLSKQRTSKLIAIAKSSIFLLKGLIFYRIKGITPNDSYQSLIQLFCLTGEWSNDVLAAVVKAIHPPCIFPSAVGILGDLNPNNIQNIANTLQEEGYYIFPEKLSTSTVQQLIEFAMKTKAIVELPDGEQRGKQIESYYNPAHLEGTIYRYKPESLINNPTIQRLMIDTSILSVAQAYLGSSAVLDAVNMWWSTAFKKHPDSRAAQLFHFDMDRIRWVKFFVYLTDVDVHNGPHCFVAKSHKTKGIPNEILSRGYTRISDKDIRAIYSSDRILEFAGPAGTIIAEDTRGLHKGKVIEQGHRLILEFEFSNSLFGGSLPNPSFLMDLHKVDSETKCFISKFNRIYKCWVDTKIMPFDK